MFKIPSDSKQFKQDNSSDRKGNIYSTRGISFERGYLKQSQRVVTLTDSSILTDLLESSSFNGVPAIVYDRGNSQFLFLGTKNTYKTSNADYATFAKETSTSFPNLSDSGDTDAIMFYDGGNQEIFVVSDTASYKFDGSAWTSLSQNGSCVAYFKNLKQIAFGYYNEVTVYNTSMVEQNQLVLPAEFAVTKMAWNNNKLYIATRNTFNTKAMLFTWDGLSSEAERGDEIDGHTIYSVVPYKSGVACITSDGELLYYKGGWQVLDRLPVYYKDNVYWDAGSNSTNLSRKVCANGMLVDGDYIYIGLNARVTSSGLINDPRYFSDFPSGVWCYNPEVGLHHKYSVTLNTNLTTSTIATTSVNTTTDVITVSGVTVPASGTPVFYYNDDSSAGVDSNSIAPLKHGKRYYTIYQSGTTLKLATTYDNAIAGTAINLTSTGNNNQYLIFSKNSEFASLDNTVITSLCLMKDSESIALQTPSKVTKMYIAGYTHDETLANKTFIAAVVDAHDSRGIAITPKLESDGSHDTQKTLTLKFKPLVEDEDKIIVKYRTTDNTLPDYRTVDLDSTARFTEQWVDGNTFTSTHDLSMLSAGNEVEIVAGRGAGHIAHITSITENAGTYTVNLDETIPSVTAGDKLRAIYSNWKKANVISVSDPDNANGYKTIRIDKKSKWIQFKIELRGFNITIEDIIFNNSKNLSI